MHAERNPLILYTIVNELLASYFRRLKVAENNHYFVKRRRQVILQSGRAGWRLFCEPDAAENGLEARVGAKGIVNWVGL